MLRAMCAKKPTEPAPGGAKVTPVSGEKAEHDHDHDHEHDDEEGLSEEEKKKRALESYQKAGKIAKEALDRARSMTKIGVKVIDLIVGVEDFIAKQGGGIGFPMNVSINNVAAHYTSGVRDMTEIEEGMIVKLDLGVHVNGYVADTATTVSLSKDPALENICTASEKATQAAIDMIKVGAQTNDIGKKINEVIKSYKYQPIKDLSGHSLERWNVHGPKQIPLIPQPTGQAIEEGDVFAVETFASTGEGQTHALQIGNIYQLALRHVPKIRNQAAKQLIGFVAKNYKTLPFSQRAWAKEIMVPRFALNELVATGVLMEYKVLSDVKGSFVSQAERTVYVHKDSVEILT
ncbi:MAG: type II methionyl aminopeptidase [Candidatus Lokiarchaeota archaeon]|nr:type II methionyl aminopeptidase [Candidatus Lokiarchaeota archaeon]